MRYAILVVAILAAFGLGWDLGRAYERPHPFALTMTGNTVTGTPAQVPPNRPTIIDWQADGSCDYYFGDSMMEFHEKCPMIFDYWVPK